MNLKFIAVAVSMVTAQSNGYAVNAPTSSGDAMTEKRLRRDPFQVSFLGNDKDALYWNICLSFTYISEKVLDEPILLFRSLLFYATGLLTSILGCSNITSSCTSIHTSKFW